jgi:CAAX protease family protein
MKLSRHSFFIMALVTLFGFSIVGLLIIETFHDFSIWQVIAFGSPWPYQILRGLVFGTVAAACMIWMIGTPLLVEARNFFSELISDANLKMPDLLFLSLAAGIGEEILFRAALQPFLGIWLTALIFVALHGYLNPMNLQMSIYGVLMVIISAGLGYLFEYIGIFAAMSAHFIIDLILFIYFKFYVQPSKINTFDNDENL